MIEAKHYDKKFYIGHNEGSYMSAKKVLSIVNGLFRPASVIDVGCGVGTWLKVWMEDCKLTDVRGIEGPYITPEMLLVPKEIVLFHDLKLSVPIQKRYDLAMSLEVAEHLDKMYADKFVETLVGLSDIVMFSASIKGQDGTYHINEQMPEYWAEKFGKHDYVAVDYIRDKIWNEPDVEWWYKQNILLYIKRDILPMWPELVECYKKTSPDNLLRIHPWIYMYNLARAEKTKTFTGLIKWKLYLLKKSILKDK